MAYLPDNPDHTNRLRRGASLAEDDMAVTIDQYGPPTPTLRRHMESRHAAAPEPQIEDPEPAWQDSAACLGAPQRVFFPGRGESAAEGKAICAGCVVTEECLDYAMSQGMKFGTWGGKTEKQRRLLRGWKS